MSLKDLHDSHTINFLSARVSVSTIIIQHNNNNQLKVHEPAISIHFYRHTFDHQAVPESALSWSTCRSVATWLLHTSFSH